MHASRRDAGGVRPCAVRPHQAIANGWNRQPGRHFAFPK